MTQVVLMHGKDTDSQGKWYSWFGEQVNILGYQYHAPDLPSAENPDIEEWMLELDKANINEEAILVGHSRGGVAILRWLEKQPKKFSVKRVVLVATNSGLLSDRYITQESNKGFYTENGYDFEKIKSHCEDFIVLHSQDDHIVPYEQGVNIARGLQGKLITFEDRRHWGSDTEGKLQIQIPEILEQCITFHANKALLIPYNSQREILIQDRRNYKKPDWGFFGGGIEDGETPLQAVIRETKEELDLDITPDDIQRVGFQISNFNGVHVIRYLYLYRTDQKDFTVFEGQGAHWMSFDVAKKYMASDHERFDDIVKLLLQYEQ